MMTLSQKFVIIRLRALFNQIISFDIFAWFIASHGYNDSIKRDRNWIKHMERRRTSLVSFLHNPNYIFSSISARSN